MFHGAFECHFSAQLGQVLSLVAFLFLSLL